MAVILGFRSNKCKRKSKMSYFAWKDIPSMPLSQMARSSCMGTSVASCRTANHWSYWNTSAKPGPGRGDRRLRGLCNGTSNFSPNQAWDRKRKCRHLSSSTQRNTLNWDQTHTQNCVVGPQWPLTQIPRSLSGKRVTAEIRTVLQTLRHQSEANRHE